MSGFGGHDLDRVAAWMESVGLGDGPITSAQRLSGGTQNIVVRLAHAGNEYVLRRGPETPRPTTNRDLLREIHVLSAIADSQIPHARLIAACTDTEVLGDSVFYLMQYIDGFNVIDELPAPFATDPALQRAMGFEMIDALVAIGQVDATTSAFEGIGRPEGFLGRQVPRWLALLEDHRQRPGYTPAGLEGVEDIATWLESNRPAQSRIGLMHGDYQIGNVLWERAAPKAAAVIDWEMATVGDPLLDLGWVLATWPMSGRNDVLDSLLNDPANLPSQPELVTAYGERCGADLAAVDWYTVLACFKLGIVLEGTWARACAGEAPMQTGARLHASTLELFARARQLAV